MENKYITSEAEKAFELLVEHCGLNFPDTTITSFECPPYEPKIAVGIMFKFPLEMESIRTGKSPIVNFMKTFLEGVRNSKVVKEELFDLQSKLDSEIKNVNELSAKVKDLEQYKQIYLLEINRKRLEAGLEALKDLK